MVGNRMKKIGIILLAAFIMAASICACENLETGSSELSIGSRISESRCFSFIDIIETKNYIVESWDWEFGLPARQIDIVQNRQPVVQNNPPVFRGERPEQTPPDFTREEPVRRGIPDREEFNDFMEKQSLQSENVTSNYQMYVTPDAQAVESYLEENGLDDKYEIYEAALSWVWVSDETLNCEEEKWLTPTEFLEDTSEYSSNPVHGEPASDCEEQANTLASLLIASGEYNESTVRVAVGKVDFGDVSGGHAWVEVYEDGEWFPLDSTDGPYYDDDSSELIPAESSEVNYDKYRDSTYPVVEIWYYYNDEYFIDLGTQLENAPVSWNNIPKSYQNIKSGRL
ncbi:MAG: hypothetical protein QG610_1110 [Euryarchaeota archaeon]|nr:hypothetical protein [Euryarchaeota archaeon]